MLRKKMKEGLSYDEAYKQVGELLDQTMSNKIEEARKKKQTDFRDEFLKMKNETKRGKKAV